jgi:hypothetical protein
LCIITREPLALVHTGQSVAVLDTYGCSSYHPNIYVNHRMSCMCFKALIHSDVLFPRRNIHSFEKNSFRKIVFCTANY